jgi:MFS family permease
MLAPALLLSPWFGILSDRVNPRQGLRLSMLIHSTIALVGAITTWLAWYDRFALAGLATALGIATSLHSPMRLAMVPLLVPRAALPSAVGYSTMSFNVARMIGPAIGAALVAQTETAFAWLVSMLLFITSFAGLSRLSVARDAVPEAPNSYWIQLSDGFRHLIRQTDLKLLLLFTALNGVLGRTIIELLPALSGQVLRGGSSELAILVAMAGLCTGRAVGEPPVSQFGAFAGTGLRRYCARVFNADEFAVGRWRGGHGLLGIVLEYDDDGGGYRVSDAYSVNGEPTL